MTLTAADGKQRLTDVADTEQLLRLKGQSVPAVLLAEVDWRQLDVSSRRRLYIGLTRAELKAAVVMTEAAAKDLAVCLEY